VLAENGREAVELYRVLADKIALILLDMTMPLMGGEETFRELKTIRPDVRVVLSSGYNEVEAVYERHGELRGASAASPAKAWLASSRSRTAQLL